MFFNAQNFSMRDTAIHNVGGDMTIIHNHNTCYDTSLEWAEVPRAGRWLEEAHKSGSDGLSMCLR